MLISKKKSNQNDKKYIEIRVNLKKILWTAFARLLYIYIRGLYLFGSSKDILHFINLPHEASKGIKNIVCYNGVTEEILELSAGHFVVYDFWK